MRDKVGAMFAFTRSPRSRGQRQLLFGLALALIVAAIYLPILGNGFVYDSEAQVLNDPFIHDLRNLPDVLTLRVLSRDVLDFNRPVNLASLMADSILWKKNPFGYHLTNLLLHVSICVLLFVFLCTWEGEAPAEPVRKSRKSREKAGEEPMAIAFLAALFFGLHPVNVEAVAEVAYREDLLVVFFSLTGLFILDRSKGSLAGCLSGIACFFLAAASKETGMLTPLWLAAWGLLFHRGERPEVGGQNASKTAAFLPLISDRRLLISSRWGLLLGGTTVTVGLFTAARFMLAPSHSAIFTQQPQRLGGSFMDTLLLQTRIWAVYFRQVAFPMDLCADYGPYSVRTFSFMASLLVLIGVGIAQGYLSLKSRLFAFGSLTFWFFLLPVSNFIPMFRPMADRFLYFPMIGVALMLASILIRLPNRRLAVAVFLCAAIVPLGTRTFARERIWHDGVSLWKATWETNPASTTAFNNLTGGLVQEGKPEEALKCFERAGAALVSPSAETFAVKAIALDAVGSRGQADGAFKKAVQMDSHYGNPDLLVKGLTWSRKDADKLQIIANRIQMTGSAGL